MELPVVANSLPQNHVYLQTNTINNYVAYLSFVLSIIQVWAELLCFVNMCKVALRGQMDCSLRKHQKWCKSKQNYKKFKKFKKFKNLTKHKASVSGGGGFMTDQLREWHKSKHAKDFSETPWKEAKYSSVMWRTKGWKATCFNHTESFNTVHMFAISGLLLACYFCSYSITFHVFIQIPLCFVACACFHLRFF